MILEHLTARGDYFGVAGCPGISQSTPQYPPSKPKVHQITSKFTKIPPSNPKVPPNNPKCTPKYKKKQSHFALFYNRKSGYVFF